MPRFILSILLGLSLVDVAQGQGTFQFTWHGQSNFFQASFLVPYEDLQPGVNFSVMFLDTMSVTNPLGQTYHGGDSASAGSGSFIPWALGVQMNDFMRSTEVLLHSGDFAGAQARTSGDIREETFMGDDLWYERGYWTISQVPEPSALALLAVATAVSAFKRKAAPGPTGRSTESASLAAIGPIQIRR